jgi:hypothetical protein
MKTSATSISLVTALFLLISGCDPFSDNSYREYVVLESYLVAERSLPSVLLSTTLPIDQAYSFEDAAITGADITIHLLTGDDEIERSILYSMISPGIYTPTENHTVLPRRTYKLEAELDGHNNIRARTTIPDTFRVTSPVPESIVYQSAEQLEVTISRNQNPGRQNVYVFNTIAKDPSIDNMTPFYRGIQDNNDQNNLDDFTNNSSNLINEANFEVTDDGSIRLTFPWIAVAFYGGNRIVANSLDLNTFDFIRSQDVQLGGSTLSPGEIPNAIYHVDGGIGVFGSLAADTIVTNILRPDSQ